MTRYLFHSLAAAASFAMAAGPTVCFASNGADTGAGGAKTKKKPEPAAATAPAAAAPAADQAQEPAAAAEGEKAAEPAADAAEAAQGAQEGDAGGETAADAGAAADEAPSRADPASLGFARIKHPEGATSVSYGGQTYEADKDGVITVPLVAVDDLTSHGFVLV